MVSEVLQSQIINFCHIKVLSCIMLLTKSELATKKIDVYNAVKM